MSAIVRPHVLGVDDGPFDKRARSPVPVVGVMMEGHDLVEAVALTRFPPDGAQAAEFLAGWIAGLRFASALHAVVLGGVTIAGLGVVDIFELARRTARPAIVVNRQRPKNRNLVDALTAAGLADRIPIVERTPEAWPLGTGLFVTHAGAERTEVVALLRAIRGKSRLPEPLRVAHLVGAALVRGESRGRP